MTPAPIVVQPDAALREAAPSIQRITPTGLDITVLPNAAGGFGLIFTRAVGMALDAAGAARLAADFAALARAAAQAGPAGGASLAGDGFVLELPLGAMPLLPADFPVLVEALAAAARIRAPGEPRPAPTTRVS